MIDKPNLPVDQSGNPYEGGPVKLFNANNAGVAITSSPTFLHTINVTKAGTSWSLQLYDGVDKGGTLIVDLDCSAQGSYQIYGECKVGLYAVVSGTTPGAVTIAYSDQTTY